MEAGSPERAGIAASDVVELRRYRLHRGTLPTLVDVFERHLVEPQEEQGMRVGGIFADEDDPDAFVWFRGFPGHADRVRSLESFYGGPVWARHRAAAVTTMVSSDDVLLLRPTDPAHRPPTAVPRGGRDAAPSLERLYVSVYRHSGGGAVESWLSTQVHTDLEHLLGRTVATWRTDPTPNRFPALPVRTDHVFVWAATFPDAPTREGALARLWASREWRVIDELLASRVSARQPLRLAPTARSAHPRAGVVRTPATAQ